MPKKRTGGWRGNSAGHRAAALKGHRRKGIPRTRYSGKILTLYHRTNPVHADGIIKQGFKVGRAAPKGPTWETKVSASNRKRGGAKGYGAAVIQFRVSRRRVTGDAESSLRRGERWYGVLPKDIKPGSIRRIR